MSIFESLENLNVSEECFEDIVRLVKEMISLREEEEEHPYVIHKFSDGTEVKQGQMFSTDQTGKVVDARKVGAEYVRPKRRRTSAPKNQAPKKPQAGEGQLKLFELPTEDNQGTKDGNN